LKTSFFIQNVTMLSVFVGNFIFALITRTFSRNRLKIDGRVPLCYNSFVSFLARINTYEVSVVTGDVRGAGTNANVYIIMFGEEGDTGLSAV